MTNFPASLNLANTTWKTRDGRTAKITHRVGGQWYGILDGCGESWDAELNSPFDAGLDLVERLDDAFTFESGKVAP